MNSYLRNFTHITIPAEIWLRRDISMQAKALWAEIRSLHDKEKGGCYASDEYLMEFMQLKRSRLHEVLKELKDTGLITTVSFDGRQTIRCAIVPEVEYQTGQQVSGIPDSSLPENRTPPIRKTGLEPNGHTIYKKEENKDYTPKPPKGGSADADCSMVSHGSHVQLKKEDYQKLTETYGKGVIDQVIEEMNDYCLSKAPKGYKCYAAAIRNWMRRRKTSNIKPNTIRDQIRQDQMERYKDVNGGFDDITSHVF